MYHQQALEAAGAVEVRSIEVDVRRNIGVDLSRMERYSEAMSYLEDALGQARERADRDVAMQVLYSLGDAYLRQGQVDRAMALAQELAAEAEAVQGEFHLTRAKLLQGRAFLAQGDRQRAQAVLRDALTNAHALPSRILLWELHAALGRASVDREVARIHLQIAADFIHQTIEPLSDAQIRANFLERPEVRAVLRGGS
jgi:tetratricopeptide (TPR) repeat protein